MSMTILVEGKFKNGKKRIAGFYSSSNKSIDISKDLTDTYDAILKEIAPNIHKFEVITVTGELSSNSSTIWTRPHKEVLRTHELQDVYKFIEHLVNNMNKLVIKWMQH